MPTHKKSIAPLIAAASSAWLAGCGAAKPVSESPHAPIVIDNYRTVTAEALYAQRFRAAAAQVSMDGRLRFVRCDDECRGATLKTPDVHAAVARAAARQQAKGAAVMDPPNALARDGRAEAAVTDPAPDEQPQASPSTPH